MSERFGFDTPPVFDPQLWSQPRWLDGAPLLETAHALARAGLGEVIDDGDGSTAGWRPCPQRSVIVILTDGFHTARDRLDRLFLTAEGVTRRSASYEVGNWVRFQIIPNAHRRESAERVRGLIIAAYWDWCVTRPPDPELLHVLRYRTVWADHKRAEPSSALAPTLPDAACERQTQFGGAARRGDPSDHQLDALCLALEVADRSPRPTYTVFTPSRFADGFIERMRGDHRRYLPAPVLPAPSKGEPDA